MRDLVQACVFYMFCSAGMSVFNKLAVRAMPLPITLVLVQMTFTLLSIMTQRSSIHIGSMRDAMRWGLTVPMLFAAMLVRRATPIFSRISPPAVARAAHAPCTGHGGLTRDGAARTRVRRSRP